MLITHLTELETQLYSLTDDIKARSIIMTKDELDEKVNDSVVLLKRHMSELEAFQHRQIKMTRASIEGTCECLLRLTEQCNTGEIDRERYGQGIYQTFETLLTHTRRDIYALQNE